MAVLAGVGFASGLPYVLANDTLNAWLSKIGVDVKTIGFFSLITVPYAFKFLWAPLMDRFAFPGLGALGRRPERRDNTDVKKKTGGACGW